jgi:hypothetical protein
MSQLIIADLNFFERELPNTSLVQGGLSTALATGLATDFNAKLDVSGTQAAWSRGSAVAAGVASAVSPNGPAAADVSVTAKVT